MTECLRDTKNIPVIQMLIDTGEGFSEGQSIEKSIKESNEISFDLSPYKNIKKIRIDPGDEPCVIEIKTIALINDENRIELKNKVNSTNGLAWNDRYYFYRNDPQLIFSHLGGINWPDYKKISVNIKITESNRVLLADCIKAAIFGEGQYAQHLVKSYQLFTFSIKKIIRAAIPDKILFTLYQVIHEQNIVERVIKTYKKKGYAGLKNKIKIKVSLARGKIPERPEYCYITPGISDEVRSELVNFKSKPLISIIMPVYNVEPKWLSFAIKSIEEQWYEYWELCIADDCSSNTETLAYLRNIKNPKIKIKYLDKNVNISGASNEALTLASGTYIALMDNDDELTPNALYEVVKVINNTGAEFIYTDEDSVTTNNQYVDPHFKPDYSPDLLLSHNYITHFSIIKKDIINKIGFLRSQFDGAQDHDLFLRVVEETNEIEHISQVLYHWRKMPSSTNNNPGAKPEALENAYKVMLDVLQRRAIKGSVAHLPEMPYCFYLKRKLLATPLISIIIPFRDKSKLLKTCIESILDKSTYQNYEIIGVSNKSVEKKTVKEMKRLELLDTRVHFYQHNVEFNYSEINNYAVKNWAQGEQLVLLNNDIEIISPSWLESMLEFSQREGTGVVGAKLYYPDDTIQHAGVIMGIGGLAGHAHKYLAKEHLGYFYRAAMIQNLSAVTAACLMVKKSIYNEVQGLNEAKLAIAFNDVDFCLRIREKNYFNVFTPFAEAYHHESISRGTEDTIEKIKRHNQEVAYVKQRHKIILKKGDPFYNPNLTLTREDFTPE